MVRIGLVVLVVGIAVSSGCKDDNKSASPTGGSNRKPVPTKEQRAAAEAVVRRAKDTLQHEHVLATKELATQAEKLAVVEDVTRAILSDNASERATRAKLGFQRFLAASTFARAPDILAIVDASGDLLAMHDVPTVVPKQWRSMDGTTSPTILPALNAALASKVTVATTWTHGSSSMTVGVASIVPRGELAEAEGAPKPDAPIGAALIAYTFPPTEIAATARRLQAELVFHDGRRILGSSMSKPGSGPKPSAEIEALLADLEGLEAVPRPVALDGVDYIVTALAMPRAAGQAGIDPATSEFGTLIFAPMIVPTAAP